MSQLSGNQASLPEKKQCTRCKEWKDRDNFRRDTSKKDGLYPQCRNCGHAQYQEQREQRLLERKQYRENNPEKIREQKRRFYQKHRAAIRQRANEQYQGEKRQDLLKKNREWRYGTIKGRYKDIQIDAKKRGLIFMLTLEQFATMQKQPCVYCAIQHPRMGVDRIDNSKGYIEGNMAPCCPLCNRMKGTLTLQDFVDHCSRIVQTRIAK